MLCLILVPTLRVGIHALAAPRRGRTRSQSVPDRTFPRGAWERGRRSWPARRRAPRPALTLVEILLTLCLLVVLASLTWPALGRPMARQRLRESADQVRTEWVRARVEAMSAGQTRVFRYDNDGDTYSITVQSSEDDGTVDAPLAGPVEGLEAELSAGTRSQQRRLAEKTRFVASESLAQGGRPVQPGNQPPVSTTGRSAAAGAAPPVFFYSDGTCSDAEVGLANEYGNTITLSLRGLTGVVTVGEVLSGEGLSR